MTNQTDTTEATTEDEAPAIRSVVSPAYKKRYAERALTARGKKGVSKKAMKRSCNDWLALELNALCLGEKDRLNVELFEQVLTTNGVKHEGWNRTTVGWQGRLRMSGRMALQRIVAEAGELALPDGTTIPAPKAWVAKHAN